MKNLFSVLAAACGLCLSATAQNVGINNSNPSTTLHVVGKPTTTTVADGITIPAVSGDQLKAKDAVYTTAQSGTLLYVTAAVGTVSTKTANVTAAGFYFFDGTLWQKAATAAIADSTNDAFANDAANTMVKLAMKSDGITARAANTDFVVKDDGKVGVGTTNATEKLTVASGNITATTGWVRGFATGQLLNTVFIDDPQTGNVTTPNTTGSWTDVVSYTYTPVSANSKIMVQYHNSSYLIGGTASSLKDEFQTQIIINAIAPTINTQTMQTDGTNASISQFRTGTIFPITGVSNNTTTNPITIKIQVQRSSGDDVVTINQANGTLIIQEIAQ